MDETLDPPLFIASAARHGVEEPDAQHALAHSVAVHAVGHEDDGLTMVIGPDRAGRLLEIGVAEWHGGLAIVHAMCARQKWLEG